MAERSSERAATRPSPLDELPQPMQRQIAAEQAAMAARAAFDTAVDFLERVFVRANKTAYGRSLTRWIDPDTTVKEYVAVRDSVISDVLQEGPVYKEGLAAKRDYYEQQIRQFVPVVEDAARRWALDNIGAQTQRVLQLLVTTKPRVNDLHKAALAVRKTVDATRVVTIRGRPYSVPTFVLPTMTSDQARDATGESRQGGTASTRLRRLFYMYVLKSGPEVAERRPANAQAAAYENLLTLMTHPRGVDIVDAFAKSPQAGWSLTSSLMSETLTAIVELQGDLVTDELLVWRFPPAITAGVASLGVRNRAGISQFALAWGASRKGRLDQALEIAGNSLFVLELVGGPLGAAVSDIMGFVLATIGTAVSFLRDVEQDQAAAATAFAERSERLSRGSNKIGTVLQGLAAMAAGVAVPGALGKVIGRRTTQVVTLPSPAKRFGRAGDVPDAKIGTRGTPSDIVTSSARAAEEKGSSIAARQVDNKYELATNRKAPKSKAGAEPVALDTPRATQSAPEGGQSLAARDRAAEEAHRARIRAGDREFEAFEQWRIEELGATGPLTSDRLLQMYRHGSRATVAKYLKQHLMKQAAADGIMIVGGMSMKVKEGVALEKQVDAFVRSLEGAHYTPQSFGKKLPQPYKGEDMLVSLTDKATHTAMDQPWKDAFNNIRRGGAKQATAQEVFDAVADGIRKTPGMAESEKASRVARLHDEMFIDLGLVPHQKYDVPRVFNWWEILAFKAKGK